MLGLKRRIVAQNLETFSGVLTLDVPVIQQNASQAYLLIFFFGHAGASEPKNMIYMSRLGIWGEGTPFRAFDDFLHTIEKRFAVSDVLK